MVVFLLRLAETKRELTRKYKKRVQKIVDKKMTSKDKRILKYDK